MCGVFGYIGQRNDAAELVLEGLKELEYRGYDSWGVVVVGEEEKTHNKAFAYKKRVGKICDASVSELPAGSLALGHTRWATHGGVTQENAHPHFDCTRTFSVVHNGIVENYESLRQELVQAGHTFVSETDTEVIAHLLEEATRSLSFSQAFQRVFARLEGLSAVVALHADERKILVARKGSPLVLGFGKNEFFLASDPSALLPLTKSVYFLEDNQRAEITDASVEVFSVESGEKIAVVPQELAWDVSSSTRGEFPHFMLKEMNEQPRILSSIASAGVLDQDTVLPLFRNAKNRAFIGCGTASYAALIGTYLFALLPQLSSHAIVGSECDSYQPFFHEKTVLCALSQSGETIDVLEPVLAAKKKGAKVIALVNVVGSSLFRMADARLLVGAGPEKAVASTKAFTAKVGHLILLAHALAGQLEEGKKDLHQAAASVQEVLSSESITRIQQLAKEIRDVAHIFVIGRGIAYPASLEVALKIKEISYIHAEGLAGGELKHGPLALVTKGTPCIVLLPDDETSAATLAGAMEMKARGAYVIGISSRKESVFDVHLPFSSAGTASILPIVVIGQALAYALTLERGLDPDKPRNLAKSVTVK